MKHLIDYINEHVNIDINTVEVNESANKWFRFNLDKFDGGYESVRTIADRNKLYNERIDNGIKVEVKPGQEHKLFAIVELFTDFVNTKQADDKCKATCERIQQYIDDMQEFIETKDFEEEERKKEEEEKQKEEESKSEEE